MTYNEAYLEYQKELLQKLREITPDDATKLLRFALKLKFIMRDKDSNVMASLPFEGVFNYIPMRTFIETLCFQYKRGTTDFIVFNSKVDNSQIIAMIGDLSTHFIRKGEYAYLLPPTPNAKAEEVLITDINDDTVSFFTPFLEDTPVIETHQYISCENGKCLMFIRDRKGNLPMLPMPIKMYADKYLLKEQMGKMKDYKYILENINEIWGCSKDKIKIVRGMLEEAKKSKPSWEELLKSMSYDK